MFLKIDTVDGESEKDGHPKEIEILSWTWGMSQPGSFHAGSGGGAGKVSVQDLSFTKFVDKSTPTIMKLCCAGTHIKFATLSVRKAGGKQYDYIKLKLESVLISSIGTGGSGGEDVPTENISLNFAKFTYEYFPQGADGAAGAAIPASYDMQKMKA
jgi:type VI secretion system secreted protein Hcp